MNHLESPPIISIFLLPRKNREKKAKEYNIESVIFFQYNEVAFKILELQGKNFKGDVVKLM